MKRYFLVACVGLCLLALPGCKKDEPDQPQEEPLPTSFAKNQLIEEFTGQGCGYCPYGMDCIHDFTAEESQWIVVLHHYGFSPDHFSVDGSKTITNMLKVSGAPSMTVNRQTTNYGNGNSVVFHPGYLPYTEKGQFDETTYASVEINNSYYAANRQLEIEVSGIIGKDDHPDLYLTVLLKESGMIDSQQDYYKTFEGWEQFRHTNAVRAYATASTGDAVTVTDHRYKAHYTVTLNSNWIPENCMVVAFLSEGFQPVVQVNQQPVVRESKGGADILHGGIKAVEVPDYYPEPSATASAANYSGEEIQVLDYAEASYTPYPDYGFNYWTLLAYNSNTPVTVDRVKSLPCAWINLFTTLDEKTPAPGSYAINGTMQPGTVYAGYRDDEQVECGGSGFYYVQQSYFKQNQLVPTASWLIVDGTLTIEAEGWSLEGHTLNGSQIRLSGTSAIQNKGKAQSAPKHILKK